MRGFWKRRRDEDDIAARLRHERPEPPSALVDAIVRRVEGRRWSRVVGVRLGLAAALTIVLAAAVAGFGGAGYASIALDKARSAVKDAGSAEQNAPRGGQPPSAAAHSPGHDQYGPDRVTICHRTPSGQEKTLVLPQPAAEAHLRNHEEDTPGPCPA
jgi:hypothetical protein